MKKDKATISAEARKIATMRAAFEESVNSQGNLYNLTPAPSNREHSSANDTYWSIHTERAWLVFQLGWIKSEQHNG